MRLWNYIKLHLFEAILVVVGLFFVLSQAITISNLEIHYYYQDLQAQSTSIFLIVIVLVPVVMYFLLYIPSKCIVTVSFTVKIPKKTLNITILKTNDYVFELNELKSIFDTRKRVLRC